mgnify:CR=1 FL=1
MTELSLNWKRLSSTISKKKSTSGRKVEGVIKKPSKSPKLPLKAPSTKSKHLKQIPTQSNGTTNIVPTASQKSNIELALWSKDQDITLSDLQSTSHLTLKPQGNDARKREPGRFLAIDCEFVGVGPEGAESALARVSIVNFYGHVVYDKFVKPREKVTDWRTWVSGVTPKHMNQAISFTEAQKEVSDLLNNRVLVGHAVHHDLDSLYLSHPKSMIRDTTQYQPYRKIAGGRTPSLKKLSQQFLKIDIQSASHSSVEDARATMLLYRLHKNDFEQQLRQKFTKRG